MIPCGSGYMPVNQWPRRLSKTCIALALLLLGLGRFQGQTKPQADLSGPTRLLFVFDASNSMNAYWGKSRRIDVATTYLSEALTDLYGQEGLELGLRVYGHRTAFVPGKVQDCDDSELVIPLRKGNNLLIAQALRRLEARGTTPIARSLEWAAGDFPDRNARNVLILITDGIEACDGDPCAVSEALQAQGVVVKPFIIGIGLEPHVKEKFRCVGHFFDAQVPADFEAILDKVIEQALFETTLEVDLIAGAAGGESTGTTRKRVTDLAFTFTDLETGLAAGQWVHALDEQGRPDTLRLDPLPPYRLDVHTVPPIRLDTVRLEPRKHNPIVVPNVAQGVLEWNWSPQGPSLPDVPALLFRTEASTPLATLRAGQRLRVLAGTYDLRWSTAPPLERKGVVITEGTITPLQVPAPGWLTLDVPEVAWGCILSQPTGEVVYKFDIGNPSGKWPLQPGVYKLLLRMQSAEHTGASLVHAFQIESHLTHTFAP